MTVEEALAYLKPDAANNGTISLRAPKAREAVATIEAEIAANQSRAFEDRARTVVLPAGWVAVPRYPTAAMLIAAGRSVGSCDIAHEVYAQAIAAAPALAPNSTEGRSERA
jgi:hypothetical protein